MPSELTTFRVRRFRRALAVISWMSVLALLLAVTAVVLVFTGDQQSAVALALVAVACAVLSLKET